jgi:hypothetical protein
MVIDSFVTSWYECAIRLKGALAMDDDSDSRFDDGLRHRRRGDDLPGADDQPPGFDEPQEDAEEGEEVGVAPA